MINELTDNSTPLDIRERRDWDHSGKRFGSTDKARRELGFATRVNINEGLRRTEGNVNA